MRILARHDTLIAIIGTAIMTVAFYYGSFRSGVLTSLRIRSEIENAQAQINQIPLIIAERSQLKSRFEKQTQQTELLEEQVPTESHVSDVLHQVASLARRSGLTITRLEPLPSTEFSSYSMHAFHVGCRGSFADVAAFLSGLETQTRIVTFGDVDLTPAGDGQSDGAGSLMIHASFDFNVYSRQSKSTKVAENTSSLGL
jgi:Tfp pilus assembly protein PilO